MATAPSRRLYTREEAIALLDDVRERWKTQMGPALLEMMSTWVFLRMGIRIEVVTQKILGTLDEL